MSDGFDVIVLGAGAAGMMCAVVAGRRGRRGRRVLLVESQGVTRFRWIAKNSVQSIFLPVRMKW